MLGIQSIGIKQPGRVGEIKYPFSDVVGVASVIARNGRERAGLLKSVHGEPVSLAVSNAAYESMETQTVGLFGQHAPTVPPPAVAIEAPIQKLAGVISPPQFGVHSCSKIGAIGKQAFIKRVVGNLIEKLKTPVCRSQISRIPHLNPGHIFLP